MPSHPPRVLSLSSVVLVATMLAPASEPPPPAPGGYWSLGEQRARRGEPPDGDDDLTVGSILFSLGFLRTGAAAVTVWMARTPSRCPSREPEGCRSMEIYGWVGFSEGGLMVGTGLTYLIIGLARRAKHRRWQAGESVSLGLPPVAVPRRWAGSPRPPRFELGPWWLPATEMPGGTSPQQGFVLWGPPVGGGAQLRLRF
jgi:hypothetical protein